MRNSVDSKKAKKTRMAVANTASKKEYKHVKQDFLHEKWEQEKSHKVIGKIWITVLLFFVAFVFIFVSGAFNIVDIVVERNETISTEQIISFSGIEKGTNLFAISKREIKNKLKENSYIDDVAIKRVLPNKIKLVVEERKVDYVLSLANSFVFINGQGFVLEISNSKPEVPIILGFTTDLSNIKPNDRLEKSDLQKMNMIFKIMEMATNNGMENLITKIDVSNEKDYTIYLDTENKIAYLGNGTELNTRFLYIKKLLELYQGKTGEILVNGDLNEEYVYFRENG